MARASALRVVDDADQEVRGDPRLTLEAMSGWKAGQRKCRARKRHNWGPHAVWEHPTFYDVVEQCAHCRNRRAADFAKTGRQLTKWKPDYRDNYLLPKGATRLGLLPDLIDELMLADILSRRIVEVVDDDETTNSTTQGA